MSTPKVRNVSPTSALSYSPFNCLPVTKRHPAPNALRAGDEEVGRCLWVEKGAGCSDGCANGGVSLLFLLRDLGPCCCKRPTLLSFSLDQWFSGRPHFVSPTPSTPKPGGNLAMSRHFCLSPWGRATGRPRVLLNIHNKEWPTPVSVTLRLRNCSRL